MKKYYITPLITITLIIFNNFCFGQTAIAPTNGDGTLGNPYQISSLENLYWIASSSARWDDYYVQTNNIDATETSNWFSNSSGEFYGWNPIGDSIKNFNGFYDGGKYSISNLYINRPLENNIGLFGYVGHVSSNTESTTLKNIILINVSIKGAKNVGSLIGKVTGNENTIIEYCSSVDGDIYGDASVGGLIGSLNSWIETQNGTNNPILRYSFSNNLVSSSDNGSHLNFGGLVGNLQAGTIMDSYSRGIVTVNSGNKIGGLVGTADYRGTVVNSYSTGEVTSTNSINVGGLVGNISGDGNYDGEITNSLWDTQTSKQASSAGGIGQTTLLMNAKSTFTNSGWDFSNKWDISLSFNNGYPTLFDESIQHLPIELIYFTATINDSDIELNWETASENNNSGFEVQKSTDGINFTTISWINGNGTTSSINDYSYTDLKSLNSDVIYYRFKQLDNNGEFKFSQIVCVQNKSQIEVDMSCTDKNITIEFNNITNNETIEIQIFSSTGVILYNNTIEMSSTSDKNIIIPMDDKGLHIISIKGNSITTQKKIVCN